MTDADIEELKEALVGIVRWAEHCVTKIPEHERKYIDWNGLSYARQILKKHGIR